MKNYRFLIDDNYNANSIANDLRLQLEINRFQNILVKPVDTRNEVIVQVPETADNLEETINSFMDNYKTGNILE